ncbi:MAG: hypothetical protein PHU23_09515 [Dehalococcoidales bacterium]|nr:hypothetical protein [Dehalococcoidales bacterium]
MPDTNRYTLIPVSEMVEDLRVCEQGQCLVVRGMDSGCCEPEPAKFTVPGKYTSKGFRISSYPGEPLAVWRLKKIFFILGSKTDLQPKTMARIFSFYSQTRQYQ